MLFFVEMIHTSPVVVLLGCMDRHGWMAKAAVTFLQTTFLRRPDRTTRTSKKCHLCFSRRYCINQPRAVDWFSVHRCCPSGGLRHLRAGSAWAMSLAEASYLRLEPLSCVRIQQDAWFRSRPNFAWYIKTERPATLFGGLWHGKDRWA